MVTDELDQLRSCGILVKRKAKLVKIREIFNKSTVKIDYLNALL